MAETRLLVFGGTFDPPHAAHSALPPQVARRLRCGRILYIPAAINPLKSGHPPTPSAHRLAMLRLALAGVDRAEIDTIELDRPGPSYTVDTLESLKRRCGTGAVLFLLIGSDQALGFHQWRDWPRILELATPSVMVRPPLDKASFRKRLREIYGPDEADRWAGWSAGVPPVDICATALRRRLAAGEDVSGLIHPAVLDYIREHGLYRSAPAE